MTELSVNARIVAGSSFSMSRNATIRYSMELRVPSAEMQAALDELVAAGIVLREDEPGGAVSYTASPDYDFSALRVYAFERTFSDKAPSIRIYVPKEVAEAERLATTQAA